MAMHSETSYEAREPNVRPASRTRARRPAAAPLPARSNADEEALRLMVKVVERVEVAKSFAKIAAGLLTVSAARAAEHLRVVADAAMVQVVDREGGLKSRYDRVWKIARAATDAAVHVATHARPDAEQDEEQEDQSA